jgi:hypothetical protein
MPKTPHQNAEEVLISAEDADLIELFTIRRSYNPDGTLRYVQVIGNADEVEAFAQNEKVIIGDHVAENQRAFSLPRLVMQRIFQRPLLPEELVKAKNGRIGDCRRDNLELTNRSEIAGKERDSTWANSGAKYVYPADNGRYYANVNGNYLGTFDTVEQATASVKQYFDFLTGGMSEKEAARRLKGRSRNLGKIKIG